jgi:hypothetical protein
MRLLETEDGERDVCRREGLAIVPLHPLTELEAIFQPVGGDFPSRRKLREWLQVIVIGDEAIEDLRGSCRRRGVVEVVPFV